ncbi:DNA (cytosine-5-)-methyltransferase [Intestinimonas butyriciproducens]|uniref:DNA (cytosine-5-)-methyltransferase n=1 Tax=Intestinimonas butyriciproducens TaxID=1297617 RepID=UPI001D6897AB|nr:DNA (cytosine-5-)-methyltransferase [Intestinimonas butyriciproducens]MBO3280821.1 DNA (cytosine-5-)-methyltransferase [Intestinimonas butyriciproducens]
MNHLIRYFDMFAGIGGFRAGLDRAGGFQCVGHCEIDKYADASYRAIHNIGEEEVYYPDATKIDPSGMPDFDLLCGGFPCQSWSAAGKRLGFADPRGTLFFEIARLAEARRPAYLLLENVPRLLQHDQGAAFATILSTLHDLGYGLEWSVCNSADHGTPQSRRRLFLVGYLDLRCAGKIFPLSGDDGKTLIQLIGGAQGYRVYDPAGVACTQTAGSGGTGAKTGLYLMPPPDATFVDLSVGEPRRTDTARCLTARYGQTTLSHHRAERSGVLMIREPTKQGYREATPGDSVDLGYIGSTTRGGRVSKLAHDTASVQGIVERGGRIRRLMPRECLRLQGFTDEQIDKTLAITSDAQAYKQAGNSVTVNVIEAIGRRIRAVDEELRKVGDVA